MFTRVSNPAEIETVARLAREIWTEHYTPIIGTAQVDYMLKKFQSEVAIREQIEAGMQYVLINPAAGYFAYEQQPDHLFLSKIYVHRDFRGRGLARRAIHWILEQEKPECIRLTVNRHNNNTLKAYEKLGFAHTGELVTDIGGGFVMDDYVMERNLTTDAH